CNPRSVICGSPPHRSPAACAGQEWRNPGSARRSFRWRRHHRTPGRGRAYHWRCRGPRCLPSQWHGRPPVPRLLLPVPACFSFSFARDGQADLRMVAMPVPDGREDALRFYREWYYGNHQFSAIRATFHFESSAQRLGGFADRPQTDAGNHAGRSGKHALHVEPHAIIADAERELSGRDLKGHGDAGSPRVADQVGERFLKCAVDKDLDFQIGFPGQGINLKGGLEALRNTADFPQLADGGFQSKPLPFWWMQPPGDVADLLHGVRGESGDAVQGLADLAGGGGEFRGDDFQLQADGGQHLAGAGVQFAPQSLAFHLNLADGFAAAATAPLLRSAKKAAL